MPLLLVAFALLLSAAEKPPAPALLGDSRMRPLLALVACQRKEVEARVAETVAGEAPAA